MVDLLIDPHPRHRHALTPEVRQTRKALEMVASIAGTRTPPRVLRALA
ncbi:MAG: hypothetical protein ABIQ18_39065 [Umezawaea sp.]